MNPSEKVQYGYDYLRDEMIGNTAFTVDMIANTQQSIDRAYWRLSRSERRCIRRLK